ncbi:RNA polymerase subunit sigma [Mesobacillus maritimus]|uniref:sigma factor-like helix-turn-helix DNA-binding protein n=1 Tax=Mesobacillus maritimus TaxID=1643336 RepID=UPI00203F0E9A|nr:sigma factor-like helix-turn-helix DNA-binding protein [Mesobacillus maritimus]MCM3585727.1 RNA polymerase subunit sigma [Mesobacillus maritimus]
MTANKGIVSIKPTQEEDQQDDPRLGELYEGLRRYCHFLAQNSWDAEDLVQESISKAVRYYQTAELTPALVNKIAYHQWIDTIRKRKRETVGIDKEIVDHDFETHVERTMETVKTLLDHLTAKQAVIITLKEGFRYQIKEIADLLETTETAVKSALHRARHTMVRGDGRQSEKDATEQSLLYDVIYRSLRADDPQVLIERLKEIPMLVNVPMLKKRQPIRTPLNVCCMAA